MLLIKKLEALKFIELILIILLSLEPIKTRESRKNYKYKL